MFVSRIGDSFQAKLYDFDHMYPDSSMGSPVVILYGALGTSCFKEFHNALAAAAKQLQDWQIDLEELVWNKKEVDGRLQIEIKECKMMEGMVVELSHEHDEAIVRIEQLEREGNLVFLLKLQDIKKENLLLKEIEGKGRWSLHTKDYAGKGNGINIDDADKYNTTYGIKPQKPSFNGSNISRLNSLMHKSSGEDEIKTKSREL